MRRALMVIASLLSGIGAAAAQDNSRYFAPPESFNRGPERPPLLSLPPVPSGTDAQITPNVAPTAALEPVSPALSPQNFTPPATFGQPQPQIAPPIHPQPTQFPSPHALPTNPAPNAAGTPLPAAIPSPTAPVPTLPVADPPAEEPPPGDRATFTDVIADKFEDGADFTWERVKAVWNYAFTTVDGKPITPGTIVCCLILLYIGYITAKISSWWFGSRFLPRLGMHHSAIAPVQTISFYVLLATFSGLSLRLANVPLTAFTFLGGAIAIGVGFGSQNVVNNFISGLILLAERPIRVGDVIQLEGQTGKVTQIGPRSTHVTTGSNLVVVVPNSKLLEGTVVNWTLSDDRIRSVVKVGVAYGTQTRHVERELMAVAAATPGVMREPEPFVVFADFGDNALAFELHFWISLNDGTVRSEVESDLRFAIDERFRTAGIVMAYPQRDVHLNVVRPVEIRMAADTDRLRSRAA